MLKGFGIGADVIGQLATDKALRRKSTGVIRGFDMADGELLEDAKITTAAGTEFEHSLRRVPKGALFLKTSASLAYCLGATASTVTIAGELDDIVTFWIV
jgi:hypothetical protein